MTKKEGADQFVSNTVSKEIIFLKVDGKPIGRYCELPGCNKRLVGKLVTRINGRTKRLQTFELPVLKTQKFCCESHKVKAYDLRTQRDKTPRTAIDCRVKLNIEHDEIGPYREVVLYLIKNNKIVQKIRPDNKELWETLDKIAYYRSTHHKDKLKPVNLLSLVNNKTKSTSILPHNALDQVVSEVCLEITNLESVD